jgi:hypothetical protein
MRGICMYFYKNGYHFNKRTESVAQNFACSAPHEFNDK